MKKLLALFVGVLASVCLITGCTTANDSASSVVDDATQAGENVMDGAQNAVDDAIDMGTAETSNMTKPDNKDNADKTKFIGEESAKSIALEKAGLSADQVTFEKVELDRDDGVWQYEVEFRKGRTEYDYDIKADDGSILSYDVDKDD